MNCRSRRCNWINQLAKVNVILAVLVLDPLGIWAALLTGANGQTPPGFPIAIFGGPHSTSLLDPAAAVPDIVARENVPAVIGRAD